jgi:hypothetical protein
MQALRPLEYDALLATAFDNLALGKMVFVVAPFGTGNCPIASGPPAQAFGARTRRPLARDLDRDRSGNARKSALPRNEGAMAGSSSTGTEFVASAHFAHRRSDLFVCAAMGSRRCRPSSTRRASTSRLK